MWSFKLQCGHRVFHVKVDEGRKLDLIVCNKFQLETLFALYEFAGQFELVGSFHVETKMHER